MGQSVTRKASGIVRSRRWFSIAAGVAGVAAYLALAAAPAGAAEVSASPAQGPPGTPFDVTVTGFYAAGALLCYEQLTITFQTTSGTAIQSWTEPVPTSSPQTYSGFTAPEATDNPATYYEIKASCPQDPVTGGEGTSAIGYFDLTPPPTTTTTTTTTVPTTTPTTQPVTPTTAPHGATTTTTAHAGTTPTTKPSSSTTSSTSSTTTTTKPGTTTTTTTATPVVLSGEDLELSSLSIPPAGSVSATGQGCKASVPVLLTVDQAIVGATKSGANGSFSTPLNVSTFPVGQYLVVAHCGPTLTSDLDVVLATEANPDTSTLLIIVFFLLIGLALFRRRIHLDAPAAAGQVDEEEENGTPL